MSLLLSFDKFIHIFVVLFVCDGFIGYTISEMMTPIPVSLYKIHDMNLIIFINLSCQDAFKIYAFYLVS